MSAVEMERSAAVPAAESGGRERILREARALFTAQGFAAVSMQQIADAAAVNKATLYHHFRDKEDLFVSVMAVEFARVRAGMTASAAEEGSLRERLQRVATYILATRQSDVGRLSADLRIHLSEERRTRLLEGCPAPWEPIQAMLEQAVASGEARAIDPELAARAFFAMAGSQSWWARFDSARHKPDGQLAATLADLLIEGIGIHPPTGPASHGDVG